MEKRLYKFSAVDVIMYVMLALCALAIIIPIWYIFVISISPNEIYMADKYHLIPKGFTLNEYKRALAGGGSILLALWNSVKITAVGTLISITLTVLGAYPLSKDDLPGRNLIFRMIVITMFFSGGLIPLYVLVKGLHLTDSIWALILPIAISSYNLIIMKNYFYSLPAELEESARIDGASEMQVLLRIVLPISKPVFAAIALFYGVAYFNDYFMATLFISANNAYPLQVLLRQMILQNLIIASLGVTNVGSNSEQFKMACIIIGILPALVTYPFMQKHFAKGVMMGAVKG